MIERKEYISLLDKWRDQKVTKVITGIRRCGKSSQLFPQFSISDNFPKYLLTLDKETVT